MVCHICKKWKQREFRLVKSHDEKNVLKEPRGRLGFQEVSSWKMKTLSKSPLFFLIREDENLKWKMKFQNFNIIVNYISVKSVCLLNAVMPSGA